MSGPRGGKAARSGAPEQPVLRARSKGLLSCDAAFERLYALYAPVVLGWMAVRAEPAAVDDLFQDVWTIFYNRWTRWRFSPELEAPQARPVLSFLLRTSHLTLKAHRRYRQHRAHPPLGDVEVDDRLRASESLFHRVEARRCLAVARRVCPDDEMDVLLGKLAGLSAREIALSLAVTESVVDHGYRTAVGRIRRELGLREGQSRSARPRRSKKRKGKTHV